jgi:hypothetical protein
MRRDATGGLVGLVAIAITLGALPLAPRWPAADSSLDVVHTYFLEHGRAFPLQTFLAWVGFVGFSRVLIGIGILILDAGERQAAVTAFVGTALLTAAMVFGNLPWAALAYDPPENADGVRTLWNLGLLSAFNVTGIATALALFPIGIGLMRTKILPAFYTYLAFATAIVGTVLATCFARGGLMSPNGPIGFLSIALLASVLLIGSILLLGSKGKA